MPKTADYTDDEIAQAIKDTNQEVFDEAVGDVPDENDGDRSLEEMDDDDAPSDGDETADEPEPDEPEPDEPTEPEPDEPQPQRGIPSARLKQEADARRAAEAERDAQRAEARELRARLDAVEQAQRAPAPPKAKPDMFGDPDGYEKWVLDQAEQRAAQRFETQQRERDQERLNANFAEHMRGPRSFEFQAAYNKVSSLDPRNPEHQRVVRSILNAADQGKALFDWWDENGGEDFRESVRVQLIPNYRPRIQGEARRGAGLDGPRGDVRPQAVFRNPKSLNSATGGGSQRNADPDLLNDSDDAVFRYATR